MATHLVPGEDSATLDLGQSGSGALTTTDSKERYLTNSRREGMSGRNVVVQDCAVQTDIGLGTEDWLPNFPTLSPSLCLELLPKLDEPQVKREVDFVQSLGVDLGVKQNTTKVNRKLFLKRKLETDETCFKLINKYTRDFSKYDSLIAHFSALLERAEKTLDEYKQQSEMQRTAADSYETCPTHLSEPLLTVQPKLVTSSPLLTLPPLPDPVCFLDIDFSDVDWRDVCKGTFRRIGSRSVQYFGPTDYRYGRTVHRARSYPDNNVIDRIFSELSSKLNDPSFNKEQVTCLITKYENGNCHIPFHSDDEPEIVGDIITVSLGATRNLTFRSKTGPAEQHSFKLEHGTAYAMVQGSQKLWEHGILPQPDSRNCRVSLTFRKLSQSPTVRRQLKPPRIHESSKPRDDPQPCPQERVLFLTDSILRDTPTDTFSPNTHCVKREMYQLSEILDHEMYIYGTKYVFISAGVNDLSRYEHRHYTLASNFKKNIEMLCKKYPETTFIFNSLLFTKYGWLNREIDQFNRFVFDLSLRKTNLWFFDSHDICCKLGELRYEILDPSGNGIHLASLPRGEIARCLVQCIGELSSRSATIRKYWPLRKQYVAHLARV